MTDTSDFRITQTMSVPFTDALEYGCCGVCGQTLNWFANFDADGTTYHARCCQHYYRMSPETVKVSVRPDEDCGMGAHPR